MYTAILIAHLVIATTLVVLVLLQHGKGADAGAAFGSGASATVFGARGSASFLSKLTGLFAAGFFATSLTLAILAGTYQPQSVIDEGVGPGEVPVQPQEQNQPPPVRTAPELPPGPAPVPPPPSNP